MFSGIKQMKDFTTLTGEGTIWTHTCRPHYGVGAGYEAVGVEHFARDGCVIIWTVLYAQDRFSKVLATGYQSTAHEQYGRCDAMVQGWYYRVHRYMVPWTAAHLNPRLQFLQERQHAATHIMTDDFNSH
jgi:hypothetical protein